MDNNKKAVINLKLEKTAKALEANNMKVYIAENAQKAAEIAKSLLKKGDTVSHGGSVTLDECGIRDLLKSGEYNYLDRSASGLTPDDIMNIYRKTFLSDVYFTSTNALTENGELYNVDGNSNRVAAMLFGPKKVVVVAGYNKIVKNLDEAVLRVKQIAAPVNCVRLNKDTYCSKTGECISLTKPGAEMCSGCESEGRICKNYVVMGRQNIKDRVTVILVAEELGY